MARHQAPAVSAERAARDAGVAFLAQWADPDIVGSLEGSRRDADRARQWIIDSVAASGTPASAGEEEPLPGRSDSAPADDLPTEAGARAHERLDP